jgi:hypothetical protein
VGAEAQTVIAFLDCSPRERAESRLAPTLTAIRRFARDNGLGGASCNTAAGRQRVTSRIYIFVVRHVNEVFPELILLGGR